MFTGIVQGIAKVNLITKSYRSYNIVLELPENLMKRLILGSSIACDGCCLTVNSVKNRLIGLNLVEETLLKTNLSNLRRGCMVNVERAMKLSDEVGGHLLSGHITTLAKIGSIKNVGNNYEIFFKLIDASYMKYITYKGSISIDGISLTVGETSEDGFCVYLIPDTLNRTTMTEKKVGYIANIEVDMQTRVIIDRLDQVISDKKWLLDRLTGARNLGK